MKSEEPEEHKSGVGSSQFGSVLLAHPERVTDIVLMSPVLLLGEGCRSPLLTSGSLFLDHVFIC